MLGRYLGDCMGVNNQPSLMVSKSEYQWLLTFVGSGCVKVREFLYTQVTIWVNVIRSHIDITTILHTYEGSYKVFRPKWTVLRTQIPSNAHILVVSNMCEVVKINTIWY